MRLNSYAAGTERISSLVQLLCSLSLSLSLSLCCFSLTSATDTSPYIIAFVGWLPFIDQISTSEARGLSLPRTSLIVDR